MKSFNTILTNSDKESIYLPPTYHIWDFEGLIFTYHSSAGVVENVCWIDDDCISGRSIGFKGSTVYIL